MVFSSNEDLDRTKGAEGNEERTLLTITGSNAKMEGKFDVSKSIEIDCEVRGELKVDGKIVIQKNGYVGADVKTVDAQIIGKYEGSMKATGNVEIMETGVVNGNVKTDSLIINKGGIFSGNVARITKDEDEEKTTGKKKKSKSKDEEIISIEEGKKRKEEEIGIENIGMDDTGGLKL